MLNTRLVSKHLTQADALDAKARAEGRRYLDGGYGYGIIGYDKYGGSPAK